MREIHSGAKYVEAINDRRSDRGARAAFQTLVLHLAAPGATLFDFGSGPGIDVKFYADRGFTVGAYDVDPQMCAFFAEYCREHIDRGKVALNTGSYADFLASETLQHGRNVDLIVSNFAPLNLVDNLGELFRKFFAVTAPNGKILASMLSPYYLGDLRYGWWWSNALKLRRDGHFAVQGAVSNIVRRRLADVARDAAPYFTLLGAWPGRPNKRSRAPGGTFAPQRLRYTWLPLTTSRFMFLVLERRRR